MIEDPAAERLPARQGKAWSAEEDRHLYDGFIAGRTADQLAQEHQRGAGGIRARLQRLGLVDLNGETVNPLPPFTPIQRQRSADEPSTKVDKDAPRSVFAIKTEDGWAIDIRSNRPLNKALVERLNAMLRGVIFDDQS